jgi:hypothetical protein
MLPPPSSIEAWPSSVAPISLSYTTAPVATSPIFVRNLSVPPPETWPSMAVRRKSKLPAPLMVPSSFYCARAPVNRLLGTARPRGARCVWANIAGESHTQALHS